MSFHGTDLLTKYQGVTSLRRCWKKSFLEGKLDLPPKAWICLLFGDFYAFHPMGPPFNGEYFWGTFSKTSNNPNLRKIVRTTFLRYLRSIRHRRNSCFFSLAAKNPDPYEQLADPYLGSKKNMHPLGKWLKNEGFGQMKLLGWKNIWCFG